MDTQSPSSRLPSRRQLLQSAAAAALAPQVSLLIKTPPIGLHAYTWLEWAQALGTMTWYNNGWGPGSPLLKNAGLNGWIRA